MTLAIQLYNIEHPKRGEWLTRELYSTRTDAEIETP